MNGRGRRARLSILVFHRVAAEPDPLRIAGVPLAKFRWQMRLVAQCFNPLTLSEAIDRLSRDDLPPRAVCVTFDDGYADNAQVALPVLVENKIPATFFVATGFLDGGCMFNDVVIDSVRSAPGPELDLTKAGYGVHQLNTALDRISVIQSLIAAVKHLDSSERDDRVRCIAEQCGLETLPQPMMSQAEVRTLADAGMEIGGHTVNHPILAKLPPLEAQAEIAEGRSALAAMTGQAIDVFAYPNGKPNIDYGREHIEMVRNVGFRGAVCTVRGSAHGGSDLYQLPRFTPWDSHPTKFLARLIANWRRNASVVA